MKKENTVLLLGLVAAVFLVSGCTDTAKLTQLQNENAQLKQTVAQKDIKIKALTDQVSVKEKEVVTLKKELEASKGESSAAKTEADNFKKASDSVRGELDNARRELDSARKELADLKAAAVTSKKK